MVKRILPIVLAILMLGTGSVLAQSMTLDNTEGLDGEGNIPVNSIIRFNFRLNTGSAAANGYGGVTNGYKIYSPDNATWTTTTGDTMPLNWGQYFDVKPYARYFGVDGQGSDTVAFGGVKFFATNGLPANWNNIVYYIQIGPIDPVHHNKTIVLDSSWYPTTGRWLWANNGGGTTFPEWNGPHTFTIKDPSVLDAELVVTPNVLNFAATAGGPNPAAKAVTITELGGTQIDFTATENSPWLSLSGTSGTTPLNVNASVDITGLAPGDYQTTVSIASDEAGNSPVEVTVNLTVEEAPKVLAASPLVLNFEATEGGVDPAAQTFGVSEVGGGAIDYAAAATMGWISLTDASGTTPSDVTVNVSIAGLAPGNYSDVVTVTSTETGNDVEVVVNLTVNEVPKVLVADPVVLNFSVTLGDGNPADQNFTVSEDSDFAIDYTAAATMGWISLDGASGTTPGVVTVSVDVTGLAVGDYSDVVTVSSPDAAENVTVAVNLSVTAEPEARLQVIHNVADPAAAVVDVLVNGEVFVSSFAYGSATPFSDVPALTDLTVNVTPPGEPGTVLFTTTVVLSEGLTYAAVVVGVSDPGSFAANPEGASTALDLVLVSGVDEGSAARDVNLMFFHGATDAPAVDIVPRGGSILFDNLNYKSFSLYAPVPQGAYLLDVTPAGDNNTVLFTIPVDLTGVADGSSAIVVATGFVNPSANQNGPAFGINIVSPNGDNQFVYPGVYLTALPDSIKFTAVENGEVPADIPVLIDTEDGTEISFAATESSSWLDLNGFTSSTTPAAITISADQTGVEPGTYVEQIMVTSEDADNSPIYVKVVFEITERINNLPVIDEIADFEIDECGSIDVNFTAADADSDPMTMWVSPLFDNMSTQDVENGVLGFAFNPNFNQAGSYTCTLYVADVEDTVFEEFAIFVGECEPGTLGDTLSFMPPNVPAVPGAQVSLDLKMANICDVSDVSARLGWDADAVKLDSVVFTGSVLPVGMTTNVEIDNVNGEVSIYVYPNDEEIIPAGTSGLFATFYFAVDCDVMPGFYPIDVVEVGDEDLNPSFYRHCGELSETVRPFFFEGGIVVDLSGNYVCGYVVDPEGEPIPGATVELWADFPCSTAEMTTLSSGTGVFSFGDFMTIPFDLWAYKEGYYPAEAANLNFSQSGIMLVLEPIEPVTIAREWLDVYCEGGATWRDCPLPVGSVIDAYDPDGVRCGSFTVTTAGEFGFLRVWGDDPEFPHEQTDEGALDGDQLRFFVNGVEAIADGDVTWNSSPEEPRSICLSVPDLVTQTCQLYEGWNLISWRLDTPEDEILSVLESIGDCLETVLGYEQGGLTYDADLPQFSDLTHVDHLSGYWVKVNCDVELVVSGRMVPVTTPIPLNVGWNLVSYLPEVDLATADALESVLPENLIVALGYEDGIGQTYRPEFPLQSDLTSLTPCSGYWLKIRTATDLVYPGEPLIQPDVIAAKSGQRLGRTVADVNATTSWMNLYSFELTLNGKAVRSGATVEAFNESGVKVGSYTMTENGKFGFMPVYGDDPATSGVDGLKPGDQFSLTVDGVATNETFTFGSHGDKLELGRLSAKSGQESVLPDAYSLNQNYPNPFNPTTTISFNLPVASEARLEVFNLLGMKVATLFDGNAQAGENLIEWDGTNSAGQSVASGIYFYRLTAGSFTDTKKMTLLK